MAAPLCCPRLNQTPKPLRRRREIRRSRKLVVSVARMPRHHCRCITGKARNRWFRMAAIRLSTLKRSIQMSIILITHESRQIKRIQTPPKWATTTKTIAIIEMWVRRTIESGTTIFVSPKALPSPRWRKTKRTATHNTPQEKIKKRNRPRPGKKRTKCKDLFRKIKHYWPPMEEMSKQQFSKLQLL